jgi:ureidoacrylate peracid hydrolase
MALLLVQAIQAKDSKSNIKLKGRYYRLWPSEKPLGHIEEDLSLDRSKTAFLLVDVYGLLPEDRKAAKEKLPEFYRSSSKGEKERVAMFKRILAAKKAAKSLGLPIIYLTNYLAPSTNEKTEWRNMSIRTCNVDVLKSWQEPNDILAFSKRIAPEKGDYLIKKQMYSGFFETHLESLLNSLDVRTLVVVGFDARICLGTTVTDAMYRNFRIVVLRDCTKTSEFPDTKKGGYANLLAIRFIETNVGYTTTSKDFIKACKAVK